MNSKRRKAIEEASHDILRQLKESKEIRVPEDLEITFFEEDNTILSRYTHTDKTISVNVLALGKQLSKRNIEVLDSVGHKSIAGWLICRELYFVALGKDHQTDTRNLTQANADAFRQGYNQARTHRQGW